MNNNTESQNIQKRFENIEFQKLYEEAPDEFKAKIRQILEQQELPPEFQDLHY